MQMVQKLGLGKQVVRLVPCSLHGVDWVSLESFILYPCDVEI